MDQHSSQWVTARRVQAPRTIRAIVWGICVGSTPHTLPPPPALPADLPELSGIARIVECLRYFLLKLEWALAPGGELRALSKAAARVVFTLGLLLVCAGTVLSLLAGVLAVAEVAAGRLEAVLWHLFMAVLLALATVVVGGLLWGVLRTLVRGTRQRGTPR